MSTPALTLIAQPWRRHRVGLAAAGAVLLLLHMFIRSLDAMPWVELATFALLRGRRPILPLIILPASAAASGYVINAILFLDREGDLSSGYPRRLFTLPIATWTLTFWPMFMNVATVSLLWLLTIAMYPGGYSRPPVLLPMLVLGAAASWLQAMVWCPFGVGWYRFLVCLVVYSTLAAPPLVVKTVFEKDLPWESLALLYALGAWGVAYWAVSRARRGDAWMPWLPGARLWEAFSRAIERRRGFRSPASAQLWYETRCHLWMLPVVTFWFLGFFGVVLSFTPLQADRPGLISPFLFGLAAATPVIMAVSVSTRLGQFEPFWSFSPPSVGFAGTRPMTTQAVVVSKLRIALASVLLTWVGVSVFVGIAVIVTGNWSYAAELARATVARYDGRSAWLLVALGLVLGPALSWKSLTGSLPASLRGRRWAEAHSWAFAVGTMASAVPIIWFIGREDSVPLLRRHLPWVIVVLAIVKLLVAYIGFRKAIARRLIDGPYTAWSLVLWLAFALYLGGFVWLAAEPFDHQIPFHAILIGAEIVSPLGRFALAPLALDLNRHR